MAKPIGWFITEHEPNKWCHPTGASVALSGDGASLLAKRADGERQSFDVKECGGQAQCEKMARAWAARPMPRENPPTWAPDEALWREAEKQVLAKYGKIKGNYAIVAAIYKKLGGRVVRKNPTREESLRRAAAERDVLRDVALDGYRLTTWDTGRHDRMWKSIIGYELMRPSDGVVIFRGEDFACSPLHAIDSDECLRSLLSFLTLRPGDTDRDYFDGYTDDQMSFAEQDAERLAMWADRSDGPPFIDWTRINP